jgi:hypothetical protein
MRELQILSAVVGILLLVILGCLFIKKHLWDCPVSQHIVIYEPQNNHNIIQRGEVVDIPARRIIPRKPVNFSHPRTAKLQANKKNPSINTFHSTEKEPTILTQSNINHIINVPSILDYLHDNPLIIEPIPNYSPSFQPLQFEYIKLIKYKQSAVDKQPITEDHKCIDTLLTDDDLLKVITNRNSCTEFESLSNTTCDSPQYITKYDGCVSPTSPRYSLTSNISKQKHQSRSVETLPCISIEKATSKSDISKLLKPNGKVDKYNRRRNFQYKWNTPINSFKTGKRYGTLWNWDGNKNAHGVISSNPKNYTEKLSSKALVKSFIAPEFSRFSDINFEPMRFDYNSKVIIPNDQNSSISSSSNEFFSIRSSKYSNEDIGDNPKIISQNTK